MPDYRREGASNKGNSVTERIQSAHFSAAPALDQWVNVKQM
jgi:hypothetical protein